MKYLVLALAGSTALAAPAFAQATQPEIEAVLQNYEDSNG